MTWKEKARDVILAVMRGSLADGVSREEMLRRVDESYPFGPRKNYPYTVWLEVRRNLLFEGQDGPVPTHKRKPSEAKKLRITGVIDMFEKEQL